MAQIDSSIYFQQQSPDLFGSFTKGYKSGLELGKESKERAEKDAYNKAMSESYVTGEDGKTHFSGDMAVKKMRDMALGSKAYEMEKQFKADALNDLKLKQTQANDFSNFMGNANYSLQKNPNQQTYDTILKDAASRGYDTSKMPAQYSPYAQQMMDIYHGQAIGAQKQIENQFNQHKSDREDQQFEFDQKDKNEKRRQDQEKIGIERDKVKAEKVKGAGEIASKLRQERSSLPTTRATQEISSAYNKIQTAAKNPSAAGDLSLIFGYMKLLDPGSTVREGEFANAQNAAGIPDRIMNAYNNALRGERLNSDQRKDFISQAGGLYKSHMAVQDQIDSQYRELAKKSGASPDDVILNFQAQQNSSKPTTVIQGGHTYTLNPQTGEYE